MNTYKGFNIGIRLYALWELTEKSTWDYCPVLGPKSIGQLDQLIRKGS